MANAAPIVINDGKATPAAVTFNPEEIATGIASFVDRTPGVAVGFRRVIVQFKPARGSAKVNRSKYAVEMPVTTTVNGITTVAYILRANVDVILPDQSTIAERNDLFAFLQNGLNAALVRGAVRDLDPIW
jgi:hypothetical protein